VIVGKLLRHLRLLPAVMVLAVTLLGLKTTGLVMEARAQDASGAQPAPQQPGAASSAEAGDSADDPETSSGQVDVLTSLSKRRAELDARERDVETRENLIKAAEDRVDGKIADLKQLQAQIQAMLQQHDAAQQKQIDSLVKTYTSMKPKDAARIFNNLNDDVLLAVAAGMKPDVLGAILAQMQPDAAQKLTVKLADKLKLPDTAQATPAQVAALAPATAPLPAATPDVTPPTPTPAAATPTAPASSAPSAAAQTANASPSSAPGPKAPAAGAAAPAPASGK
jgi:flagellar motility protein MotE (MotC chaperone)